MNQTTLDTYRRMHELLADFPPEDERRIIAAAMGLENIGLCEIEGSDCDWEYFPYGVEYIYCPAPGPLGGKK